MAWQACVGKASSCVGGLLYEKVVVTMPRNQLKLALGGVLLCRRRLRVVNVIPLALWL